MVHVAAGLLRHATGSAPDAMGKRTKARECAVQMLYQWDITREPMDRVAGLFWQVRSSTDETQAHGGAAGARRAGARSSASTRRSPARPRNWRFERIAAVDRNILRLAAYELMQEPETPSSVIIDEAVEMAKRFGEADSPPFVNGVLDAMRRAVRGEEHEASGMTRHRTATTTPAGRGLAARSRRSAWRRPRRCARWASTPIRRATSARTAWPRSAAHGGEPPWRSWSGGRARADRRPRDDAARPRQGLLRDPVRRRGAAAGLRARRTTWARRGYRLLDLVDRGDFVGVAGRVMRTRKGELSVQAQELTFLSKALLPPPEKWHGLSDVEIRYRQRYVDLMANPEVRRDVRGPQRDGRGDPALPGRARLRRGRDADDAAHRRAARWRGRSSPTTTRSTWTSTCASRPSCT